MSILRVLTDEQIKEAKGLRKQFGYTKKQLAEYFSVSQTAIWENVYSNEKNRRRYLLVKHRRPYLRDIEFVVKLVQQFRNQEYTSGDISKLLEMELLEVNYIFSHYNAST